ncbi:MAG: maleylpyruvate isomerase family mycothiol-dependent enzyme, partial [Actinomycetota bacterium]|nr:maleylpyruvate isomerase family mycothiol-dependent enzyme [Actinomycetota bacterium]
ARLRITDLLRQHGGAVANTRTAACPNWTVREVLAHLVGVTDDALAGNLEAAGTDPWTEAQVDKRSDRSLEEILHEWDETGPKLEQAIAGAGAGANQLVFDTANHEHDIRQALHAPGAQDADSTHIALEFVLGTWSGNFISEGFEPLRLNAGTTTVEAGEGKPVATVAMPAFEALRALSGRRSAAQLVAYDWDADPTLWLPSFTYGPFTVPEQDIVE